MGGGEGGTKQYDYGLYNITLTILPSGSFRKNGWFTRGLLAATWNPRASKIKNVQHKIEAKDPDTIY